MIIDLKHYTRILTLTNLLFCLYLVTFKNIIKIHRYKSYTVGTYMLLFDYF